MAINTVILPKNLDEDAINGVSLWSRTGYGIDNEQTSVTGKGLYFHRNLAAANTDSPLARFYNQGADDQHTVEIVSGGGLAHALFIEDESGGANTCEAWLGRGSSNTASFYFHRNLAAAITAAPLAYIYNQGTDDEQCCVDILSAGIGYGLILTGTGARNSDRSLFKVSDTSATTENNTNYSFLIQTNNAGNTARSLQIERVADGNAGWCLYADSRNASNVTGVIAGKNAGTGNCAYFDQNGNATAVRVDGYNSNTTALDMTGNLKSFGNGDYNSGQLTVGNGATVEIPMAADKCAGILIVCGTGNDTPSIIVAFTAASYTLEKTVTVIYNQAGYSTGAYSGKHWTVTYPSGSAPCISHNYAGDMECNYTFIAANNVT